MEAVNGVMDGGGPPPPSPLTGCYLLIVIGEPHSQEHKNIILQRIAKGLLSWDVTDCLIDLEKELAIITEQAPEGEEARYGERLIQYASENLVTEVLIHPAVSTLAQCVRNLLSSFTRHRHIIHAGYTFAANGSWILQDGTFSYTDFAEAFHEIEVQRVIRAYENSISVDLHCSPEGDWTRLPKESFAKNCKVRVNPVDVLTSGSPSITNFLNYISPFLVATDVEALLECSDVVGNIRFSHPTLYIFPGGQGDAALFGINGFNMLLDGGFSRKACFWDFVRHLDRLDAVLLTRLNNGNVNGLSAVLRRKMQSALYPQIGHFFCNIQERKSILSPDGDKDRDPLLINLLDEGQEIINNLKKLNLTPQSCYRDTEPINLYHKVGHGTLDMYVLSPARDSKEVRDFIQRWNTNDQKLFANQRSTKDFQFPLQNLVSICALLIWQPANPNDNITRILYPGSTPQQKIFEGVEKLRNLDYVKYPVCSESKLVTSSSIIALKSKQLKDASLEKLIQSESKKIEKLKEKPPKSGEIKSRVENKLVDADMTNGVPSENDTDKTVKKSDSTDSDKSVKSAKQKKVDESKSELKQKDARTKSKIDSKHDKKKLSEKKASPTTPKKILDAKVNGESKDKPISKPIKYSPSTTPAKSAKEATNRKVIESKNKITAKKEAKTPTEKKEPKPERKPISRRAKAPATKTVSSPVKKVNGVQRPDILKKAKLDKEGTTDSSTVSTPSADQKDLTKLTPEELEQLKAQELADLKEEQEVVKEIEAVFRKGEVDKQSDSELRKVKDISLEDKSEPEEYLIIEKEEIEHDSLDDKDTKEDETQKHARDSEESEKMRKLSDDIKISMKEKEELLKQEPEEIVEGKDKEDKEKPTETSKEVSVTSPEDKIDTSIEKKTAEGEQNVALESQPDERYSATVESGATTAPTLPEDERITLDEIKEDNGDQVIEEKHVKEDTKEKDVPVIQLPAKPFEAVPKLPPVIGIRLDKQSHIRDIVKTPDEVADLPVHEEADIDQYHMDVMKTSMKTDDMKLQDRTDVEKEKDNDIAKGIISKEIGADAKEDAVTPQKPVEVAPKAEEIKQIILEDRVESKTTKPEELKDETPLKKPETVDIKSEVETKDVKEEDIVDTTKPQPDEREVKTEEPVPTQKQSKDDILKTVESKPEISSKTIDVSKQVEIKKSEESEEVAVKAVDEKILDVKDKEIEMVNELVEDADKDGKSTVETADKLEEVKKPPAESAVEKIEDKKPLKIEDEKAVELPDVKDKDEKHVLKEVEEKVAAVKSEDQIKKSDADVEEVVVEDTPKTLPETTTKDIEFEAESLDHKKIEEAEKELKDLPITDKIEKEMVDEGKKVEKAEDIIVEDSKDVKDKDEIKIEDSHVTKEEAVKLEEKIEPETKEKDSAAVKEEPVKMEEKITAEEKAKDDVEDAAVTKEDLSKIEEKTKAEEKPKDDIKDIAVAKEEALIEEKIKGEEKPKDDIKDAAVKMEESSKTEKEIKAEEKPKDDIKDIAIAKEEVLKIEEKIKAEEKPKDDIKDAAVKMEESSKIEKEIKAEEKPKDDIKDIAVAKEEALKIEEKIKAEEKSKDDIKDAAVKMEESSKIEKEIKAEEKPKDDIKDIAVAKEEVLKIEEKIKGEEKPKDDIKDAAVKMEESSKIEKEIKAEEKPKDDIKDIAVAKEEALKIEEKIKAEEKSKDDIKDAAVKMEESSKIEKEIKAEEKPKDDMKDAEVTKEEAPKIEEKLKAEEKPKDVAVAKEEVLKIEEKIKAEEKPKDDIRDAAVKIEESSKMEEEIKAEEKPKDDMKDAEVTKEEAPKIEEKLKAEETPKDDMKDVAVAKEEVLKIEEEIKTEERPKDAGVIVAELSKIEEKIKAMEEPKDDAVTKGEPSQIEETIKAEEKPKDDTKDASISKKEPSKIDETIKAEEKPKDDRKDDAVTKEEPSQIEEAIKAEEEPKDDVKDASISKKEPSKIEETIKTEEEPKGDTKDGAVIKEEPSKIEEKIIAAEKPKDDMKDAAVTKEQPSKIEEKTKTEEKPIDIAKDFAITKEEPIRVEEVIKTEAKPEDKLKGPEVTKEETTVLEEKIKVGEKPIDDVKKDSTVTKDESVEGQGEVKPKEESEVGVKDSVVTKKEPVKLEEKIEEEKPKDSITTEEKALDEKVKMEEEQPETRKDSTATKEETVKLEEKIKVEEKPKDVVKESIVAKEEASKQEEEIKAEEPEDVKVTTITKEEPLKVEEKIKAEEKPKVDAKDSEVTKAEPSTTEVKPKDDVRDSIATKEEALEVEEKLKADEKLKVDIKDSQVAKEEPLKVEEKLEIEEKIKDDVLTITKEEPLKLEDKIEKPKDGVEDLTAKEEESLKLEEKIEEQQTSTHEVKDSITTKEETVKLEQVMKAEEKPKDDGKIPAIPKEEEIKTEKELKDKLKEEIPQFVDTDAKEPKEAILEEKADEKKESISNGKSEEVTSSIEKPDLQKDAKQEPIEMPSLETELKEAGIKEEKIEKERVEAEIAAEKDVKDLKDKELQESKLAATKPQQGEEELVLVEKKPEKVAIDSKDAPDKVDLKEIERIEEKPLTDEELEGEESIHERDVTFYIGDQKLEKTKAEQKEEKKKEEQASKEEQKSKLEERDIDDKQRSQDELDAEELKPELDEKQGEKKADKEADTSPPSIDYKNGKSKAGEELETFAVEEIKKDKIDGHAMGSSQEAIFDSNKYANGVQEKPTSSEKEKVIIEDEKGTKEIAEQKMKKEDKFGSESTLFEDEVVVLNGESAKDSKMIKVETDKPYMPVKDAHEEMKLVDGKKTPMELSEDRDIRQDDVKSGSQTESPETSSEQALQTFKENEILDKIELGRKSPKEREQDVAKIVASVAEVLKSDAPLEEFEGKLPLNITPFVPFTTSYTTELRETHITTVESPIRDDAKDVTDVEATEKKESKRLELLRDSKELMEATSKIISDIKGAKDEEQSDNGDTGTVHRMLVTASSEDGGEEVEICAKGTITFSKSPDSSSGRSSPDRSTQKLKSEEFAASGTSTPDIKVVSEREKAEVEDTEKDISDRKDSGKSTPKSASRMSPVSDSGIIEADKQDLGKSTPEPKDSKAKLEVEDEKKSSDSGRSTPEMLPVKTVETLEEPTAKVMFDSGRSSPDSKSIDDEKLPHDESKLEKAEDKLDEELKEDKKLESKQEIIKESAITQIDSKSDSIESTDTTKIPKPSELKSVDDKDITKDAPHLAKEKVETLSEAPSTDEIPPSYQDVEHAKTSEVKSEDIVTKDIPLQAAVQKEIYTLKDEEDNIVKKEVEVVKASSLQERPEAGADEAKQADEKTKEKYVQKQERSTIDEQKLEEIADKDGVKTFDISTTHELSSTIEKDSDSKIADKEVGHSADLTSEVKVSEQKLADESQQHKSDGSTQKIDDAVKMHPLLSKEMEKEGMDKKIEELKVGIDQESKEAKIAETIDHKKSDLDEKKIQPETEPLPGKEALDISAPGQGISTSEEVLQKHPESKPDTTESKELPVQATSIKATEAVKDPKATEAEVDLKQTVSSKETEQKQQESKDSKIIAEDKSVKKSIVEQKDELVHADTKLDELSKDIAKDIEEEVTSKERIQKDDPDVKKTTLDSKSDIESSTIKEGIKEDISSAPKTQDKIEKVTTEKPTVITQSTLEQEIKISKLDDKFEDVKGKDLQHKEDEKTDDVKEKVLDQQEPEAKVEEETSVKKSTAEGDEDIHLKEKPGEVKSEKKEHKDVEVEKPKDDGAVKEKDSKLAGLIEEKASEVFESKKGAEIQVVSKEDDVKDKVGGEGADPKLIKEEISKQEKQISDFIGEASHVIDAEDAKVSKDQQIKDEVCGEKSATIEISIGEKKDIPRGKEQIEEAEVVDVSKLESSLKTPIEKIRTDLGKEDAAETPGQIVESKLEQPSSESSATLSKSEATTKAKVDGVQSVAQDRTEQSLEKEFAKVEDSKSKIEVADKELDSSKSSVIVVDHTKAEDDKLSETTTKPIEDEMSIKTETSVVEKTVKELDIDKGIKDTVRVFIESEKAVKDGHVSSIASSSKESSKRDSISGKSTPDIADVERDKQWQENLTYEKHIPGASTPPTVPVSPIVKDISPEKKAELVSNVREQEVRSCTPASDDYEHGVSSTHSDISLSQMSRAPNVLEGDEARESDEEDILGSPTSVTSQIGHSPSSQYDFDDDKRVGKADQMSVSFYGTLPGDGEDSGFKSGRFLDESDLDFEKAMREHRQARGEDLTGEPSSYLYEITTAKYGTATTSKDQAEKKTDIMTSSFIGTELPGGRSSTDTSKEKDPIGSWGKPLGLPSPAPPDNKGTPKKEKKLPPNVTAKNKLNDDKKRSESPSKYDKKQRKTAGPIYVDLTYVPHHGNSNYSYVEFFKRIRARYYVFSGIEPSKEVYNALLEAKQTWEDKELEVTIIPTYDTDVLGYWVAENEELLTKYKIDLSPSASRCTINLQDHETSCSAYRLEF